MTTSSSTASGRQPRSTTHTVGEPLPTLLRVPQLGSRSACATAPASSAVAANATSDSSLATSAAALQSVSDESSESHQSRHHASSHSERFNRAEAYHDLPDLPPVEEPAGRSWMETVGSRLVLLLMFLAVAATAILATREDPAGSPSMLIAEKQTPSSVNPDTVNTASAELDLTVAMPESIEQASDSDESPSESASVTDQPELDLGLPEMDLIEDDAPDDETLGLANAPELAMDTSDDPESAMDSSDDLELAKDSNDIPELPMQNDEVNQSAIADMSQPSASPSTNQNDNGVQSDQGVQGIQGVQGVPVYARTRTPDQVSDWTRYASNVYSARFAEPSVGATIPDDSYSSNNQFSYPTNPVEPSPLNRQTYAVQTGTNLETGTNIKTNAYALAGVNDALAQTQQYTQQQMADYQAQLSAQLQQASPQQSSPQAYVAQTQQQAQQQYEQQMQQYQQQMQQQYQQQMQQQYQQQYQQQMQQQYQQQMQQAAAYQQAAANQIQQYAQPLGTAPAGTAPAPVNGQSNPYGNPTMYNASGYAPAP